MTDIQVLIVEDEGIEALDIQHRLISMGYPSPLIAFSGEEAMDKAGEICPDVVLMDIMLHGGIDGVTAAEELKNRFDIPVIYLTAYANEDIVQRAKRTHPYGYIVKPFKENELHIAIEMALYKHAMEKKLRESHELRTPLNAIIGFAGTLLMRLPGPLTTEQENQLRNISVSAKHLLLLINDILDLAKIESGNVELYPRPVSCQSVIKEITDTLAQSAVSKGIGLDCDLPGRDMVIHTDRRTLVQILINLVANAIKFTEKGKVGIKLRRYCEGECNRYEFSVSDTGIGIKKEDRERLFNAFERAETPALYCREGTGLGLYLSSKLATLLGGNIVCMSEYGKGSTFTLVLYEKRKLEDEWSNGGTNSCY
ncbi:MAG: ATP-binding protein [Clostridia bacterium]|jgi:signal transduction histidine kinase|nr:hybrid sensor histidine kinase/response regulator [Clostridiales bacterium]